MVLHGGNHCFRMRAFKLLQTLQHVCPALQATKTATKISSAEVVGLSTFGVTVNSPHMPASLPTMDTGGTLILQPVPSLCAHDHHHQYDHLNRVKQRQ